MDDFLSFQTVVPKRFVHRQAVAEVFLTDCLAHGDNRFLIGAQWPRLHAFYWSCTGRYDTMLLAETLRQCAIYLAHVRYGVTLRSKFTMQRMQVDAAVDLLTIGSHSAEVDIAASVTVTDRRDGKLSAFTVAVDFRIDGQLVGSGSADANVLLPPDYVRARWRGGSPKRHQRSSMPPPVDFNAVGVRDSSAVVLGAHSGGPASGRWLLRTDVTHPVLFDHPLDHVPGALVLEAICQGARLFLAQPRADVQSINVKFRRFLEIDEPTTVAVRSLDGEGSSVEVHFSQWGQSKASGTVRLAVPVRS